MRILYSWDKDYKKCVAVSCTAKSACPGRKCVPSMNMFFRDPCPQFSCEDYTLETHPQDGISNVRLQKLKNLIATHGLTYSLHFDISGCTNSVNDKFISDFDELTKIKKT